MLKRIEYLLMKYLKSPVKVLAFNFLEYDIHEYEPDEISVIGDLVISVGLNRLLNEDEIKALIDGLDCDIYAPGVGADYEITFNSEVVETVLNLILKEYPFKIENDNVTTLNNCIVRKIRINRDGVGKMKIQKELEFYCETL